MTESSSPPSQPQLANQHPDIGNGGSNNLPSFTEADDDLQSSRDEQPMNKDCEDCAECAAATSSRQVQTEDNRNNDTNNGSDGPRSALAPEPGLAQQPPPQKKPRKDVVSPFWDNKSNDKKAAAAPPAKRPPRNTVSSLPIPPLTAPAFGLIQEELATDPFALLVAITFLIRTKGTAAIPVFRELMAAYPGPADLAGAEPAAITAPIRPLGLSAVRCAAIQRYARMWILRPPSREVRYGVKNYPRVGDASHVHAGQEFGAEAEEKEDDEEAGDATADATADAKRRGLGAAWEIGHLTSGPYALDSWRIFCRDVLLGRAEDWKGKGRRPGFQPEWMRVLPLDKELRAYLRWMWMQEGWIWDPVTGEREPLTEEMGRAVNDGRLGYDDRGGLAILSQQQP